MKLPSDAKPSKDPVKSSSKASGSAAASAGKVASANQHLGAVDKMAAGLKARNR